MNDFLNHYPKIKSYNNLTLVSFGSYYKCDLMIFLNKDLTILEGSNIVDELKKQLRTCCPKIKYIDICVKPYLKKEQ